MSQQKGKIGVTTENIFPVIKKFLYSDHEIFLRELVANAVDATQKVKALASTILLLSSASRILLLIAENSTTTMTNIMYTAML